MADTAERDTEVRVDVEADSSAAAARRLTLSRTLARRLRDEARLHAAGGQTPGPLLRLLSTPRAIWRACPALGSYFSVLLLLIGLAAVLSLVSIYPVVAASLQRSSGVGSYRLLLDGRDRGTCTKGWRSADFVTDTSAGVFCAGGGRSSPLACPAVCVFNSSRLDAAQCRGVASATGAACAAHLPCSGRMGAGLQDADGLCLCCDLQLDTTPERKALQAGGGAAQALPWLVVVGGVLLQALLWWLPAAWASRIFGRELPTDAGKGLGTGVPTTAGGVHWSNYTVLLQWDARSVIAPNDLAEWGTRYGEVVAAVNIASAGETLRVAQQLQHLRVKTAEQGEHHAFPIPPRWCCFLPLYWCHWAALGRSSPARQALHDAELRLTALQTAPLKPTGKALVTFALPSGATACLAAAEPTLGGRTSNLLLCRRAASSQLLKGEPVIVCRAPEPGDIRWEHIERRGWRGYLRMLPAFCAAAAVCGVSLGFQYGFAAAALRHTSTKLDFSYASGVVQSSARPATAMTLAIVSAVFVVAFNGIISWVVSWASRYERWATRSAGEAFEACVLAVMWTVNMFLLPLGAALMLQRDAWYLRGGLAEQAFWVQVANAGVPSVLRLVAPGRFARRFIFARYVRTQDRMNQLLAEPSFPLPRRLAAAVATLALGVLWLPALPVSSMLALAGLVLQYAADQVEAIQRAPPPIAPLLGGRIAISTILQVLPALQLLLMWRAFLPGFTSATAAFWVGAACWGLFTAAALAYWARSGFGSGFCGSGGGSGARIDRALASGGGSGGTAHYTPQVPPTCSDSFREQVHRAYELPPALAAAAASAASLRGPSADIAVRAGSPVSVLSRHGSSAHGAGFGTPTGSVRPQPDGRYDPHTPPLVPRAGSLRGGGEAPANGTRMVSTSVFTPSLDHDTLPPEASPGNMSDGTPSAPMLPGGPMSAAASYLPAALAVGWHGGGGGSRGPNPEPPAAEVPHAGGASGSRQRHPSWRRNGAYESADPAARANTSPYTATASARPDAEYDNPQRRGHGSSVAGSGLGSHPLAFGSYVQPHDDAQDDGELPASRPAHYPNASPDSSPFRPRQVRFEEHAGAGDKPAAVHEPTPWPTALPPLAVDRQASGAQPHGSETGGHGSGSGSQDAGGIGQSDGSPVYAAPPAPAVVAQTSRAGQPSYLRAHLEVAALLAAQRQEREEQRQRARRSPC